MNEETINDRRHPAVVVIVGELREEIDIELAKLIELIWKAGIEMMMSCKETSPGITWIEFDSPEDLIQFLNLVIWYEDDEDSLYARVNWQRFELVEGRSWEPDSEKPDRSS